MDKEKFDFEIDSNPEAIGNGDWCPEIKHHDCGCATQGSFRLDNNRLRRSWVDRMPEKGS